MSSEGPPHGPRHQDCRQEPAAADASVSYWFISCPQIRFHAARDAGTGWEGRPGRLHAPLGAPPGDPLCPASACALLLGYKQGEGHLLEEAAAVTLNYIVLSL